MGPQNTSQDKAGWTLVQLHLIPSCYLAILRAVTDMILCEKLIGCPTGNACPGHLQRCRNDKPHRLPQSSCYRSISVASRCCRRLFDRHYSPSSSPSTDQHPRSVDRSIVFGQFHSWRFRFDQHSKTLLQRTSVRPLSLVSVETYGEGSKSHATTKAIPTNPYRQFFTPFSPADANTDIVHLCST